MALLTRGNRRGCCGLWLLVALAAVGCTPQLPGRNQSFDRAIAPSQHIPNGEFKIAQPQYVVEPPDLLLIDAIKVVPKAPYRLEQLDMIHVRGDNVFPEHPIDGNFQVEAAGTINLGAPYGTFKVVGLSVDELTEKIQRQLEKELRDPSVTVTLVQTAGAQQIAGPHLVAPDGTVNLATYGQVYVAGKTLDETRAAIEKHLARYLETPKVTVDVASYNSKVFYVVTDGGGAGDRIARLPITGGETVLDAIGQMGVSPSSNDIYISRPSPDHLGVQQRLPVDWKAITKEGNEATNYQLMPNDRLVLVAERSTVIDQAISKAVAPVERISGVILLGTSSIRSLSGSFSRNDGQNNF